MNGIPFPQIDPVAFAVGPVQIHWYALAYLAGFMLGWAYAVHLLKKYGTASPFKPVQVEDVLPWCIAGVILGGRIVYTLVYNPVLYMHNPGDAFKIWQGGMSFHGGLIGVIVAIALYARAKKLPFLAITDVAAALTPIGLFLGRIANFVNGELYGRATTLPWGVVFPDGGPLPRHPSQLYEALMEGALLFVILNILARRKDAWTKHGLLSGIFLIGYGISRLVVECVREPDQQMGYFAGVLTMGQILCVPMLIAGVWIVMRWNRQKAS